MRPSDHDLDEQRDARRQRAQREPPGPSTFRIIVAVVIAATAIYWILK